MLRTNEKRLIRESAEYRERAKSLEEELHKVKAARSVDDLQKKELEEQLEAEQYFSTLYKTQVRELQVTNSTFHMIYELVLMIRSLQGELDDVKDHIGELKREKETLTFQLQQTTVRAEKDAIARYDS